MSRVFEYPDGAKPKEQRAKGKALRAKSKELGARSSGRGPLPLRLPLALGRNLVPMVLVLAVQHQLFNYFTTEGIPVFS